MSPEEMNEALAERHGARVRELLGDLTAKGVEMQAQMDVLSLHAGGLTKDLAAAQEELRQASDKLDAAEHQVEESGKEITRLTDELASQFTTQKALYDSLMDEHKAAIAKPPRRRA